MTTTTTPASPRFHALLPLVGTASGFVAMFVVAAIGAATAMMTMM